MSLFDTLFPQQRRAPESHHQDRRARSPRIPARRTRRRDLGFGEQLERRDLLAVTVVQETPTTFFTDFSRNFNSEYASYTVKNVDSGLIDAWVKVNFPASSEVGIGLAYNNYEDGLYRVGPLNNGESNEAFLYYTAKKNTTVAQPYTIEVWNGKPGAPGSVPLTPQPIEFTYDSIVDTIAAEPNKVSTVTISPAAPVIGDIMTMTVEGRLGSGANRVLFAPATRSDWQPDIFELRNVSNKISGTVRTADRIFYDNLPGGGSDQKLFTSVYEFLVTGALSTPTPVDPTQWTQDGKQDWKHHKPDDTPFPPIPPITYDFTVSKTDGKATYTAGDLITYTLTIQNNSNLPVNDVLIKDTLPLPLINVGATAWTVTSLVNATRDSLDPNGVGDTLSGTVDFGAKGIVTIQIQMPTLVTATGPLTNTVSAKVPGDGEFTASDTNLDVALSLTKDDGVTTYTPGGSTTYTIVLSNTGTEPLNGITLDDTFPAQIDGTSTWSAVYTGGASSGPAPGGLGNDGVGSFVGKTVNLGGKGGTVTITINAKILSSAAGPMTNTIEATLATGGPPITASDTNSPVRDERLTLTKDDGKTTYVPGTTTTYTIVLKQNGLSDVNGLVVSDILPVQLDPLTTTWSAAYSNASGTLPEMATTGDILGTVNLKGSTGTVTITINGVILSTATDDMINTVNVRNGITLSATDKNTCTPQVALSVDKTDGTDTYVPGTSTTYTITITNAGPSFLSDGTISDPLPVGVATGGSWSVVSTTGAGTAVTPAGGTGSINANLDLAAGGQVVIAYTVDTSPSATAPLVNTVTVTPPQGQGVTATDTDTNTANPTVSLTASKTDGTGTYVPGNPTTYTIVVGNSGPSFLKNGLVTDTLPPQVASAAWTATYFGVGSSGPAAGSGPLNETIDLAVGGSAVFLFTVQTKPDATGDLVNTVTIAPPPGTSGDPASATDKNTCTPVADLSVTKTDGAAPYVPGTEISYTITAFNAGPSTVFATTISDPLPAGTSFVSASGGATYDPVTGVVTFPVGTLAPGGSQAFTLTLLTAPDRRGILENTVVINVPDGVFDPNLANNTFVDPAADSPAVSLTASKTDGKESYLPGETLVYTIILTNNGPSTLINGTVSDPLPVQIASATWTAVYSAGSSGPPSGSGAINATITLPPKGTATFTFTAIVSASAVGQLDNTVTLTPPPGTSGNPATATDTNFPAEPPLSVSGALVVGSDDGCNGPPWVYVLDPDSGQELSRFLAYDSRFRGSVRVATGDVTGDGVAEIITAPGRNAIGEVKVFQRNLLGATLQNGGSEWTELTQYRTLAFGPRYRGGVEVAVADIDGDQVNDIVTAMSINSGMVNVFKVNPAAADPVANAPFRSFRGSPNGFNNGVMITAGDYLPGGGAEIAVGTNSGTRALVRVFDVSGTPKVVRSFNPFANGYRGGVTLSSGDYDANGSLDLIVGSGINGRSLVEAWNPATSTRLAQISAFSGFSRPNARVFAVLGDSVDGFVGDSSLYGVQGLNGGRGSKGVRKFDRVTSQTSTLSQSTFLAPPLRIAPIALRLR